MTPADENPYATPAADLSPLPLDPSPALPAEGPSGLGGWLILPLLGLIFRPIIVIGLLAGTYLPLFQKGTWAKLTTPSSPSYHPLWAPILSFEIAYNLALLAFCIYLAVHFLRSSAKTPRLYILMLVAIPAFLTLDQVLASQIPNLPSAALEKNLGAIIGSIASAAVWVPYFLHSVRVRNTFIR